MKNHLTHSLRSLALALSLGALACATAWAQNASFPTKPLKIVVPNAAGGAADITARTVAQKLSEALGQAVVIENKPSAGGIVAGEQVARAEPDGHTLLLISSGTAVSASLFKSLPFDTVKDFTPVSKLATFDLVIAVAEGSRFKTFAELMAYAKANPGKLNYSSSGIGSIGHLSSELFNVMAGTEMVHIPTKGGSAALNELLAGRIDLLFEAPTLSLPFIKSGKLQALASSGKERSKSWAALPTISESLPGFQVYSFIGLGATTGTPEATIRLINQELKKIVQQADVAKRLVELGGEPQHSSPEEFRQFVEQDLRKWQQLIDVRKIERQ